MTRLPGWEQRLIALVEGSQGRPYQLGRWDCAIFAALAVEALTGWRPAELAGAYRSKASALRFQRAHGETLAAAVTSVLGGAPLSVRLARRGDILLRHDEQGTEHLGVCIGPQGVTLHPEGMNLHPLGDFDLVWGVG